MAVGLEGIIDHQTVGKPCHDTGVDPVVHLAGQEESVSPQPHLHGVLQTLGLVAIQQIGAELVHMVDSVAGVDDGAGQGDPGILVTTAPTHHTLIVPDPPI